MAYSPILSGTSPPSTGSGSSPPGQIPLLWRDPILRIAFLVVGVLIAYQLALTLLHPPWIGAVTDWVRAALAWPELALVCFVSLWLTRTRRPEARLWWMLSGALLSYTIARNLWTVYDRFIYPNHVPFPILPDIFFLLQYPFFFSVGAIASF